MRTSSPKTTSMGYIDAAPRVGAADHHPSLCAPPDDRAEIEFVLGVMTTEKRTAWRESVRKSFFRFALRTTVFKLVLRGMNASQAVRDEARLHQDTIFLPSSATLPASTGPLVSSLQWLQCAAHAWPRSQFIG